jgi:Tfp pilus assembly protein FimT
MMRTIVHQARSERGVTLIDTMVTLGVMAIVASMATMQIGVVRRAMKGDGAMRAVMAQLNTAREMAITQRRNMEVQFVGGHFVQIIRNEVPSGTTVVANVELEGNARYSLVTGVPDTPDNFGNTSAVSFGSAAKIMFGPNGALIDTNGSPVNGTVFLQIADFKESFRAVTVAGATGRVRGYRWNGSVWTRV